MGRWLALLLAAFVAADATGASEAEYAARRAALVKIVEDDVRATSRFIGKDEFNPRVIEALATVPRHAFVSEGQRRRAYLNRPLPIGHGQTISQPYIVALMTDLLEVDADDIVLEIGTGSGYQAAILAELVKQVYTIEIVEPLGMAAAARLTRLGYDNVVTRLGDGYYGWEAKAPFDAIVVTAAASHLPPLLIAQLKPGGRMVVPVGGWFFIQHLVLVEKDVGGAPLVQSQLVSNADITSTAARGTAKT